MLIRFRAKNFLSFKDEVEFSMIPGKTRQHTNHVLSGGESRHDIDLLRAGVIYGANASGKSNLVKAIGFARDLIVTGVKARQSIQVKPFKLDNACASLPSKFEFEFRYHLRNYLYGFEVNARQVQSEWLYELKKTTDTLIFERRTSDGEETSVEFGVGLSLDGKKERDFLQLVVRGTRPNQLFLRESIDRNVKYFEEVYNWFADALVIIFPESRYFKLLEQAGETQDIVDYLDTFGTGVCGYKLLPVSLESEIPREIVDDLNKNLKPGQITAILTRDYGQRYQVTKNEQQELNAVKLMLTHKMPDCEETVLMETSEESDGTVRLLDLIPILTIPEGVTRVFIVDELDRSLHPALCYELIERFMKRPGNNQLIVTTHESNILTFDLLRRDEIWFVEKNLQGATAIYSLEEFNPRYDKDIQKGYLLGRFGAIPIIAKKPFYQGPTQHA